jgi:hypothetical protein
MDIDLINSTHVDYIEGINTLIMSNSNVVKSISIFKIVNNVQILNQTLDFDANEIKKIELTDGYYVFVDSNINYNFILLNNIHLCLKNLLLKTLCEDLTCENSLNFNSFIFLYSSLTQIIKEIDIETLGTYDLLNIIQIKEITKIDVIIERLLHYCKTFTDSCGCN